MTIEIFSDGASRGNPGVSAIAFMILSADGRLLTRHSKYVGMQTNNQAEYEALIAALESASELHLQEVVCYLDSELVVKHLTGEYRVRNPDLKRLWLKVQELKKHFSQITFKHVTRGIDTSKKSIVWLIGR
ncbi:MAG: ribonuclease HI family protein [Planctomycetota bacterium]|jgi:ribonuclease HI